MLLEKGEHYNTNNTNYNNIIIIIIITGARKDLRNNEKQLPYDLSAKNPEVGRLLMHHSGKIIVQVVF